MSIWSVSSCSLCLLKLLSLSSWFYFIHHTFLVFSTREISKHRCNRYKIQTSKPYQQFSVNILDEQIAKLWQLCNIARETATLSLKIIPSLDTLFMHPNLQFCYFFRNSVHRDPILSIWVIVVLIAWLFAAISLFRSCISNQVQFSDGYLL